MERAAADGATLEFQVAGNQRGEPVVIDGALIADSFRAQLGEPRLIEGYRLLAYHRRGRARGPVPGGRVGAGEGTGSRGATGCRGDASLSR